MVGCVIMMINTGRGQSELPKMVMNSPAYHYILFNADSILEQHLAGYQNVEKGISADHETSYRAFSITKTFTAVAIMQLVESEQLHLDAAIDTYIPEYRFSEPVTIRQLLNHQSGLANPIPLRWTHLQENHDAFSFESFCDSLILSKLKLKHPPGKKFSYSNLNYLVLGKLIEKITDKNYEEYVWEHILEPLESEGAIGFDHPTTNQATGYHPNTLFQNVMLGMLLDKEKTTYIANDQWLGFHPFYMNGSSYGGLFSSAKGLMTYGQAMISSNDKLLSKTSFDSMLSEQMTSNGKSTGMSLGWFLGTIHEAQYYYHAGGGGGYYAELRVYPELGVGSIVMLNSSGMKDHRLLDVMDAEYLGGIKAK